MDYTRAKLHTAKGDVTKEWYAYWSEKDASGKKVLCKHRGGMNYIKDKRKRTTKGKIVVEEINKLLSEGWRKNKVTTDLIPLKQVMLDFLEQKKSLERRTWQSYEYSLNTFFEWMEKEKMIDYYPENFTRVMALRFCDYMMLKKKYAGKTFNGHIGNLSTIFNLIVDREMMPKNPFKGLANQPETEGAHIPFDADQKDELKKHLEKHHPGLLFFVKFIYHCFIRPKELLRVKIGDINIESRSIIIYGKRSKNRKQLPVVIPDSFIEELKAIDWSQYSKTDFLFGNTTPKGRGAKKLMPGHFPISRNTVTRYHSDVLEELKFSEGYTMYGWKHTGNIDAYNAGVDVYALMRQNRHHSLEQTIKYLRGLGLSPNIEFSTKKPAL